MGLLTGGVVYHLYTGGLSALVRFGGFVCWCDVETPIYFETCCTSFCILVVFVTQGFIDCALHLFLHFVKTPYFVRVFVSLEWPQTKRLLRLRCLHLQKLIRGGSGWENYFPMSVAQAACNLSQNVTIPDAFVYLLEVFTKVVSLYLGT